VRQVLTTRACWCVRPYSFGLAYMMLRERTQAALPNILATQALLGSRPPLVASTLKRDAIRALCFSEFERAYGASLPSARLRAIAPRDVGLPSVPQAMLERLRTALLARVHTAVPLANLGRRYGDFVVEPEPVRTEGTLTFRRDYTALPHPVPPPPPPTPPPSAVAAAGDDEDDEESDGEATAEAPAAWTRRRGAAGLAAALDVLPRDLHARMYLHTDGAAVLARLRGTPGADSVPLAEEGGPVGLAVEDLWQAEREYDVEARVLHVAAPGGPRRPDCQLQLASLMPIVAGADAFTTFLDRHVRYTRDAVGVPRLQLGAPAFEVSEAAPATAHAEAPNYSRVLPGRYAVRRHTLRIVEE
jgi:hypothetical protein